MGQSTAIHWTDSTVNPTAGCEGCELWAIPDKPEDFGNLPQAQKDRRSCYAGILHDMRAGHRGYADSFGEVKRFPGRMMKAAKYRNLRGLRRPDKPWLDGLPRLIFVSDLSDALSESVSFEFLAMEVIEAVASAAGRQHEWLWLTKRPVRMAGFSQWLVEQGMDWPLNLWAGTSITKYGSHTAHERARLQELLKVGNADTIRFISVEPQFGPAQIDEELLKQFNWVVQGGASARRYVDAHPFDLQWTYDLRDRCADAEVPFFLKQLGSNVEVNGSRLKDSHGSDWSEWPEDVRIRQMPIFRGSCPGDGMSRYEVP